MNLQDGYVNGYSQYIDFIVTPNTSRGRRCSRQSVIKIDFSGPYKSAKIVLEYERPRLWTLDISDSPTGDGYGGDNGTTSNMAETQIHNKQMRIYGNAFPGHVGASVNGDLLLKVIDDVIRKNSKLVVEVSNERLDWKTTKNRNNFIESKFLYTLDGQKPVFGVKDYAVYVGFNRVVAGSYRQGSGLCKATVILQRHDGKN